MVTQTTDGKLLFQFYRPGARQVTIAGDFNGWHHAACLMTPGRDGWWQCQIELPPGTHRFRYLADGEWFTDYAAFGVEPGPYGWNSVVLVHPPVETITRITPQRQPVAVEATLEQPVVAPTPAEPRRPVRRQPERKPEALPVRQVRRRPAMAG